MTLVYRTVHDRILLKTTIQTSADSPKQTVAEIEKALKHPGPIERHQVLIDCQEWEKNVTFADICRIVDIIVKSNPGSQDTIAFLMPPTSNKRELIQLIEFCLIQDGIQAIFFSEKAEAQKWLGECTTQHQTAV